jgi:hypothetical protein
MLQRQVYHMVLGRETLLKGTLKEDSVFIGKLKVYIISFH